MLGSVLDIVLAALSALLVFSVVVWAVVASVAAVAYVISAREDGGEDRDADSLGDSAPGDG